jgi:nucleotide-binding universal stress UspA family protein
MNWPPESIVVPVDFSDLSKEALDTALEMTGSAAKVKVIHVLPRIEPVEPVIFLEGANDELRAQHARQSLKEWLKGRKYRGLTFEVTVGNPGHDIAEYAEKIGADMIVMPSHGRSGVARLLIGSVAERTVRLAHCPVLVLRKPK